MKTVITLKNIYIFSLQYSLHNNCKPMGVTIAKEEFETLAKVHLNKKIRRKDEKKND
jgi:hypothetical protein